MSGVKSLRAMFEQRKTTGDSSSPPDQQRGRTPVPDGSESPRPLSRVRTSFIAVEKNGRIGLQRDPSRGCSRESTRSISGEKSVGTPHSELSNAFDSAMADAPPKTSLHIQPIPQSPPPDAVAPAPAPAADPVPTSKPATEAGGTETGGPVKPAGVGAVTDGPADTNPAVAPSTNGKSGESVNVQLKGPGSKTRAPLSKTTKAAPGTTKSVPKIDLATATTSSKSAKSPVATAAPKTPTDTVATAAKTSLKTPDRRNVVQHTGKPTSAITTPRGRATASASATAARDESSAKKPASITAFSPPFSKPKVKSPTKPVKLPAGLMMQTAASEQRRSQSRSTARPPSSAAERWAPATKKTTTLKRRSSNINRPAPSLGPPPKLGAKDHPPTRKESEHVDEAFLERMMRPTTASSSKVHGKVLTPPRKQPTSASGSKQTTPRLVKKIPPPALSSTKAAVAAPCINIDAPTPVATTGAEQRSPAPAAAEPVNPVPVAAAAVELVQEDETAAPVAEPSVLETTAQEIDPAADESAKVIKDVEGVTSSQESERPESSGEVEQTPEAEQQPTQAETVAA